MLKITRVTVVEEWTDEDGERQYETVLEMAAPAKMLAGWDVAGNVSDVVHGLAGVVLADAPAPTTLSPAALATVTALPVLSPEQVDQVRTSAEQVAKAEADKPKRKRRTKAEIAADEAAQAAGFRDAAHQAEAEAAASTEQAPVAEADAPLDEHHPDHPDSAEAVEAAAEAMQQHANGQATAAGYMTPDGPVVAEAPAPVPAEQVAPAAAPAPAASTTLPAGEPWNPFARG